jgi:hypothetical protein
VRGELDSITRFPGISTQQANRIVVGLPERIALCLLRLRRTDIRPGGFDVMAVLAPAESRCYPPLWIKNALV